MNYQNGKIYKIVSDSTDKIYIGSTCSSLSKRFYEHNFDYKLWLKSKQHYKSSFELVKNNDCDIILLELFSCNNKDELHQRERYWIEQNKDLIINKIMPIANEIQRKEHLKQYRELNKEKIKQYRTQPYKCDCGSIIILDIKAQHKRTTKHKQYIKDNTINISQESFDFIFKCDSTMLLPKTYINFNIV
jgi:hypothetical protein